MKQRIFTLMVVIALVIAGNAANAQTSTALEPWIGGQHSYKFTGLTDNDLYAFSINTSGTDTAHVVSNSDYTITGAREGVVASNEASVLITWNDGDGVQTYNVWFKVTGPGLGDCSNYRYVTVTPQATYIVNFNIYALDASNSDYSTLGELNALNEEETIDASCFVPANYLDASVLESSEGTEENGSVYVYYKVTRTAAIATMQSDWSFHTSVNHATNWEYFDGVDTWTAVAGTINRINVDSGTEFIYIRGIAQMPEGSDAAIAFDISGGTTPTNPSDVDGTLAVVQEDYDLTDNTATITIKEIPGISGGFVGE
ncbi:hypothetical protein [Roseimarinus sediminis]|uniref:hypothetical protein n=1 Tax=Roseimarinus sediminis TaxID=1610899 RepID=UPI003D1D98E2